MILREKQHGAFALLDQAIEQVAARCEQIRELEETKSQFFSNITHEFRLPLTLIIGPVKSLIAGARGPLDEPVKAELELVLRNSRRLLRLVNQVLDLSKLDAGYVHLNPEPQDLTDFMSAAVTTFAPLARQLGVDLIFDSPDGRVSASFDRDSIEKVVANLLSNALKFTPAGGRVTMSVRSGHDLAEIVVEDTGVGIPSDQLPHIFDRFYQGDDSVTRAHEGTGIGLALARELVELHGGSIEASSRPGRGSTFIVRLPVGKDDVGVPRHLDTASNQNKPWNRGDGLYSIDDASLLQVAPSIEAAEDQSSYDIDRTTVLVVDDHPELRAFIRGVLEPTYRVLEAENGSEALAHARDVLPDLVITDVMMPETDGFELCRLLREDLMTVDIPVIFLSASAATESRLEGMLSGGDVYLTKPFDAEVLWAQVGNLIAGRHRLRSHSSKGREHKVASAFANHVCGIIEDHISDPEFTVEKLSDEIALSQSQLYRRVRDELQMAPSELIRQTRLERAAELLESRSGTISEIAYAVGFNSISYFGRCFREHFGMPPSEFASA